MIKLFILLFSCVLAQAATISFTWDAADTGTTGYNLYGILGAQTNKLGTVLGIDTTTITVNAAPNGNWKFQVTAIYGDVGESVPSNVVPVIVQPAPAPTVFQPLITAVGNTFSVTTSWSAAPHDYYVTGYTVRLTKPGVSLVISTSMTSAVFTGLSSGHYDLSVVGINMTGEGLPGTRSFNIIGGPPKNLKVLQ